MKRTPRLLVVGVLGALALTGCGSGPARGGAAATVGDGTVSLSTLKDEVQRAADDPAATQVKADVGAFQADLLSSLVEERVVEQAAHDAGVTVSESQVDAQVSALQDSNGGAEKLAQVAGAAGYSPDLVRVLARTQALTLALGDRLTADVPVTDAQLTQAYQDQIDQFDKVSLIHLPVATLADAQALLPQAKALDDEAFAAFVTQKAAGTNFAQSAGPVGPLSKSDFSSAEETAYGQAAFSAKVGDTFAVQGPNGAYLARLVKHDVTSEAEAAPELRRSVLSDQIQAATTKALSAVRVRINPRFGTWDATQQKVVPRSGSDLSVPEGGNPTPTPTAQSAP